MLKWTSFKNIRDCFFDQAGGKLAQRMNALCVTMGKLLQRQSDRSRPRTMFNNGVREGLLQAHHMTGVILVLAFCVRCTKGSNMLMTLGWGPNQDNFASSDEVCDWSKRNKFLMSG